MFSSDFNECVAYASPCLPGETCNNTEGSYTCRRNKIPCGRGYHLIEDGTRCEGGFWHKKWSNMFFLLPHWCSFFIRVFSPLHVTDVDECRTGIVCGVHGCVNLVGTYRCECRNGFIFNSISKLCEGTVQIHHFIFVSTIKLYAYQLWNLVFSRVCMKWVEEKELLF